MVIENISINQIKPYEHNPRKNEKAVPMVKKSIEEFGFKVPIIIDENNVIVCGHTRYKAAIELNMAEVPCVRADDLTPEQIKAFRLADNKVSEIAEWDFEELTEELEGITELDMEEFGFFEDATQEINPEVEEDNYESTIPDEPKAKTGDIYQLGRHRLMCGDSTSVTDIEKLMDGVKADLVFTDPPYGMKKEADGVANDNLNYDDLLEFNRQWIPLSFDALKENGSWYCWGTDEPLMDIYSNILKPMIKANKITWRNLITWKKENDNPTMLFNGACSANNRSYYTNEKCLFVMSGVQGFNNNSDNYFEKYEPIRSYLENEAVKAEINAKNIKDICGVGMYGHWFTKSQWDLIPKEHFDKIQSYCIENKINAFGVEYEEIKKEYEEIKKEFYDSRAYFDGTTSQCIDVWVNDVTSGKEKESAGGHATPKPLAICARAIKSSSRENENVLDVFGGSGSTLIACEELNRNAYLMELEPKWVDVIIDRWEKFTGQQAVLLNE